MLRIIQNNSAGGAKSYYSTADYYTEGQELVGQWRGQLAERLGLSGPIASAAWDALCDNQNPATGELLTARRNQERTVGYDFNFHCPKSVSLLYGLTRDDRVLSAFQSAVADTMKDIESEMQTRVRIGGRDEERHTGNMLWGEFTHFTSRPVGGVPDPHLHIHAFAFNCTFDHEEQRYKAGQFRELKRDAPYFEAMFHSRLARHIEELGLPVERTKTGWEISGISTAALRAFSRRTAQIEQLAKESGIVDPAEKDSLGAKTREHKKKNLSLLDLEHEWRSRLSGDDRDSIDRVAARLGGPSIAPDHSMAQSAVAYAADHCFERESVLSERVVLTQALKHGVGKADARSIQQAFRDSDLVFGDYQGRKVVTSKEAIREESSMLDFARSGRGNCLRLGDASHQFQDARLNDGQEQAVLHVLTSSDRVILVRGGAGVGKTTMMREAVAGIEANGKQVFTFAPSADASRGVLASEGFTNAETVSRLLVDDKLQAQLRGQVMWIDEAGLLGTRTLSRVFDLAKQLDARVVLSGDRRQHGSVERGAALRLLETEAGCVPADIREIQRQKGAYMQAVKALSEGNIASGFAQLDELGWIKEVDTDERYKVLATDYASAIAAGKSVLVVSPTHAEGANITAEIRETLKRDGRLDTTEREITVLENLNLTQAQRGDAVNYTSGDVLVFHQNAQGHRKGERIEVDHVALPLDQAGRFQAFHRSSMRVASGDVLRVTQNGKTADGQHRLNNGALYTVKSFTPRGDVVLDNGWTIDKEFGHLAYGYVVTSHASQGKTVDRVLIGQSAESFAASSPEQFYVSVSRARENATIYTSDKQALLDAVDHAKPVISATDLVRERNIARMRQIQHMNAMVPPQREHVREEFGFER